MRRLPRGTALFEAIVLNELPLDTLVLELASSRNAIYQTVFDVRPKLRAALAANGYMDEELMNCWSPLDDFLRTDPRDVGCAQAMNMLHIYAELTAVGAPAEQRYPGVAAHLRACGPCGEDFEGLLAALRDQAD